MRVARLKADFYALTHRGTPGDAAFYRAVCAGAKSVLELGSGYGRLSSVLVHSRRLVVGLDRDPELLAAAKRSARTLPLGKQRSLWLLRGDMRRFELGQRFERVLLPYNGLYCLLSKREARACFGAVRAALKPGGQFVFDVWNAEAFQREQASRVTAGAKPELIVTLRHAGRTWDVFERSRIRRARQRMDVVYDYVPREGGAAYRMPIPQRYYLCDELRELLAGAGFVVEQRLGDFSGTRFTLRSPQLIVIARAA